MNDEKDHFEGNAARLIQASLGPQSRPSPQAREQTWRLLVEQLRAAHAPVQFPDRVLGLLVGSLVLIAVWLTAQALVAGKLAMDSLPTWIGMFLLAANLALAPVASLVIVIRRRTNVKAI